MVSYLENLVYEEEALDVNMKEIMDRIQDEYQISRQRKDEYWSSHISVSAQPFDRVCVQRSGTGNPVMKAVLKAEAAMQEIDHEILRLRKELNETKEKREECRRVRRCLRLLAIKEQHCIEKVHICGMDKYEFMEKYHFSEHSYKRLHADAIRNLYGIYSRMTVEETA